MKTEGNALLDLFCCAGLIAKGYAEAGFEVEGVDIVDRPNYPFAFHQGDALEHLDKLINTGEIGRFSLIHTSPPCQAGCALTNGTNKAMGWGREHDQLIPDLRALLERAGRPYVIEQPDGTAPIRKDVTLCGEMFGLGVIRHRHFELGGWSAPAPAHVPHRGRVRGMRHGVWYDGPYVAAYGRGGGKASIREMQDAMRVWHTSKREELTEGVPPAYGEWIGRAFLSRSTQLELDFGESVA